MRLVFPASVAWTVDWERRRLAGEDALAITRDQLAAFEAMLRT